MQDNTWVLFEPLICKEDNKVWIDPTEQRPRVIRPKLTKRRHLFCLLLQVNVLWMLCLQKKTITAERYIEILHATDDKWRKLRTKPAKLSTLQWKHDNTRLHSAHETSEYFNGNEENFPRQYFYFCRRDWTSRAEIVQIHSIKSLPNRN